MQTGSSAWATHGKKCCLETHRLANLTLLRLLPSRQCEKGWWDAWKWQQSTGWSKHRARNLNFFRFQSLNRRTQIWARSTSLGLSMNSKLWDLISQFHVWDSWNLTRRKILYPFTKISSSGFIAPSYFRILCTWWAAGETWEPHWSFSSWPPTNQWLPQEKWLGSTQMGVGTLKSSKQNNLRDQIYRSPQQGDWKWKRVGKRCLIS